jgi:hypothetical protein
MQYCNRWIFFLVFSASMGTVRAQEVSTLFSKPDSALTFSDSLAIFQLIDSLMTMGPVTRSQLAFRVSYNSNILSAGRTLGIDQFGLAPGISYYHKSGLYADLITYWGNDFDRPFYLTTASAGYLHLFSKTFSALASYDHYFYNYGEDDGYIPYSNSITISPFLELKPISIRLDYSFYFGDAYANRILPGIGLNLKKKQFLGFDRISFYPTFYALFGDELITEIRFVKPTNLLEALENYNKYGTRYSVVQDEKRVFGVMNYAFSAPLNLSKGNWLFNVTYTYSIPRALDDEAFTFSNSGFISASVVLYVQL